MIIVDQALRRLEEEGRPIRVGLVGAGFVGRAIAYQILTVTPGMRLVAVANRNVESAQRAFRDAGVTETVSVDTVEGLEAALQEAKPAVSTDSLLLTNADGLDVIVEATATVEHGAEIVLSAIDSGKHVVLMNAELNGTIGPILKNKADRAGVVFTDCDGDQPGVALNLHRFVRGIGVRPILCGSIQSSHDPYRNPSTEVERARKWGQKPRVVASFADGSKVSFAQAITANATGMTVARRGMYGFDVPAGTFITDAVQRFPFDEIAAGQGIVDYVVGADPAPGVFVIGEHTDPFQQHYLRLYKLGDGPYYCFYTPYHLCHFEAPLSVARAAIFRDAAVAPLGGPRVDVVATTKKDLAAGTVLDGVGGYATYGQAESADTALRHGLLPHGLAESARLRCDVPRDHVLTYDDVELPTDRLAHALRREQDAHDWGEMRSAELVTT